MSAGVLAALMAMPAASVILRSASPKVLGIAQVTFYAKDVAASRAFYGTLLGFADRGANIFHVNDRQSIQLIPEKEAGTDRLLYIEFRTDGIPPKATPDPDGHMILFSGAPVNVRPSSGGAPISTDLRHAGVLVGSLSAAMKFYVDTLGFKETWRGSRDNQTLDWVNVQVPGGDDYIEFMLYRDLPAPDRRGTQHHICLFVADLDKALTVLAPRAAAVGYTRPLEIRTGINRKRQLNLYDPDGTRVELMEDHTVDGQPALSSSAPPPKS